MEYGDLAESFLRDFKQISAQPIQKNMGRFISGEMFALSELDSRGPVTPSGLVCSSGTTTAHIAKLLRSLEAKGEIRRTADLKDRRRVWISITDAGRQRLREKERVVHAQVERLFAALGEQDAGELVRITARIAALQEDLLRKKENR